MRTATRHATALLIALTGTFAGCATTEKGPEGSSLSAVRMASSRELASAVEDYREARYQQAFDRARTLARASQPPLREQAAWVAGLAAYQMGNLDEAELQFMTAARSEEPRLRTDTKIMMGDIRVLQNRWFDAARFYREAVDGLVGEERSRVLGYAEVSAARAHERAAGLASTGVAGSHGGSGGAAAAPGQGASGLTAARGASRAGSDGLLTLQAGAFQSEQNARRRANEIAPQARSAGLGDPRVVHIRDASGREYWTVQVGSFASRESAESAKARMRSIELFVTAAG